MKFENCDIHDNTFIENAVVNAVGTMLVEQAVKDEGAGPGEEGKRKRAGRKRRAPRIVTDTYTYKWLNHRDGQLRLVKLYQLLVDERFKMLAPEVNPEDWCALFEGEPKPFTMKWTGKQAHLRYLFKLMIEKSYITFDAQSAGKWEILGCHFLNSAGRQFADWDSQKDPKRGAKTLQMFAEVLNIASVMPNTESPADDIYSELDEFADYENAHPHHDLRDS